MNETKDSFIGRLFKLHGLSRNKKADKEFCEHCGRETKICKEDHCFKDEEKN